MLKTNWSEVNKKLKTNPRKKILVVGQTPPPYHGQAIMIENTIKHDYEKLQIFHVRMNFSEKIGEVGSLRLRKIWVLFRVIFQILAIRFKHRVKNIYYPPAGPNTGPILRDIIILGCTRWAFKKTIYHFRAGGISDKLKKAPAFFRIIAKTVFIKPDLTIRLSRNNPEDGLFFNTVKDIIIPNGLRDFTMDLNLVQDNAQSVIKLLYVGAIKESKGVLDLLQACHILKERGFNFMVHFIGQYDSAVFKGQISSFVKEKNLMDTVSFLGTKTGSEKWQEYFNADIFCFPSYYECETFGNVLVEAMQFRLPIVATKWRGIPDIVIDRESGFLVEINQPEEIADKIQELLKNEELRKTLGNRGRELFEEKFREDTYFKNFEKEVYAVCI